ncbi:MAG: PKD domain-containing protein, partial [Acidobacteriota bacterium]|nr:PKD domain-containing protein [Acidobacteriota bacterium]
TDGGVTTGSTTVAVTPGGSAGLTPAISGPSSGTAGAAVTFTGTASGGTGPYAFAWNCDYNAASPSFTTGTSSVPCTWTTVGNHTVGLRVTDSATPTPAVSVATLTVTVSAPAGPGLPSSAFTLSGATLNSATGRYEAEIGSPITFTASEPNAASYGWAFGDGTTGGGSAPGARTVTHTYPQGGAVNAQLLVTGDGTRTVGLSVGNIPLSILACAGDAKTLCLNSGRFKVRVDWRSDSSSGFGTAVAVTPDTGEFWFLTANNIELVIKVVDGSTFNGHFWVFYGALSNLEYTITVTDTTTGAVKTYHNPLGTTASVADVNAF